MPIKYTIARTSESTYTYSKIPFYWKHAGLLQWLTITPVEILMFIVQILAYPLAVTIMIEGHLWGLLVAAPFIVYQVFVLYIWNWNEKSGNSWLPKDTIYWHFMPEEKQKEYLEAAKLMWTLRRENPNDATYTLVGKFKEYGSPNHQTQGDINKKARQELTKAVGNIVAAERTEQEKLAALKAIEDEIEAGVQERWKKMQEADPSLPDLILKES